MEISQKIRESREIEIQLEKERLDRLSRQSEWIRSQNKIFERSSIPTSQSIPSGGGVQNSLSNLWGFNFSDLRLYKIVDLSKPLSNQFPGISIFSKNTDDRGVYFISKEEDNSYFGRFLSTNTLDIIKTDIEELSSNPASIFYDGGGDFILLDGYFGYESPTPVESQNIIRISSSGDVNLIATFSTDSLGGGSYTNIGSLLKHKNRILSVITIFNGPYYMVYLAEFDLESATPIEEGSQIITATVPDREIIKPKYCVSAVSDGKNIYMNLLCQDKITSDEFIALFLFDESSGEGKFIKYTAISQEDGGISNISFL